MKTTITANWKECIVSVERITEEGLQKQVKEKYVLDALTFGEAEKRITEEMKSYTSGEFEVLNINPCPFKEVLFSDDSSADRWYKAKLQFITIDEKTEKEKRSNVTYLVQASSFDNAKRNIEDVMGGTMIDYVIVKVEETQYLDVFNYGGASS